MLNGENGSARFCVPWSGEEHETLKRLWTAGQSASQIGKTLGRPRNSVIGRVHRTGLHKDGIIRAVAPPRPRAEPKPRIVRTGAFRLPEKGLGKRKAEKQAPTRPKLTPEPGALNLALWELQEGQCHWPVNEGSPYLFCGQAKTGNGPYCSHHAARSVASATLTTYMQKASKV